MVAASRSLVTFPRDKEAEGVGDSFSPSAPLVWRYGVLRYADEPAAYRLTRWREHLRRWWYDLLKQPVVSEDRRKVFNDERGEYPSYAAARAECRTLNCYVTAMPFNRTPLGDELFDNPTFVRPLAEPEKDARFAATYADADVRAFWCQELWAENKRLRRELAAVGAALEEDEHG